MSYKREFQIYCDFLVNKNLEVNKFSEFKFESLRDFSKLGNIESVLNWYEERKNNSNMLTTEIPLTECKNWDFTKDFSEFYHISGEFYKINGIRVSGTSKREVTDGWDQPFITQIGYDGGILGLIRKRFDSIPYYLVEAKEEPGNYNKVQISTTIQATFSNLKRAHKGNKTPYSNYFLNYKDYPVEIILNQWMSEDGGRLFNKRNKIMLIEHDEATDLEVISLNYKWLSLFQIKYLITEHNSIVAPHLRSAISGL